MHKTRTNEQHDQNEERRGQTQKKCRPGGPPLEGRGAEGWSLEKWGPEGSGAQRCGAQTKKKLGPEGLGSEGWRPEGHSVGARRRVAQNFAFFCSLSRSHVRSFSLSGGSSRGILVVFLKRQDPLNVHVWALGLSCESKKK